MILSWMEVIRICLVCCILSFFFEFSDKNGESFCTFFSLFAFRNKNIAGKDKGDLPHHTKAK